MMVRVSLLAVAAMAFLIVTISAAGSAAGSAAYKAMPHSRAKTSKSQLHQRRRSPPQRGRKNRPPARLHGPWSRAKQRGLEDNTGQILRKTNVSPTAIPECEVSQVSCSVNGLGLPTNLLFESRFRCGSDDKPVTRVFTTAQSGHSLLFIPAHRNRLGQFGRWVLFNGMDEFKNAHGLRWMYMSEDVLGDRSMADLRQEVYASTSSTGACNAFAAPCELNWESPDSSKAHRNATVHCTASYAAAPALGAGINSDRDFEWIERMVQECHALVFPVERQGPGAQLQTESDSNSHAAMALVDAVCELALSEDILEQNQHRAHYLESIQSFWLHQWWANVQRDSDNGHVAAEHFLWMLHRLYHTDIWSNNSWTGWQGGQSREAPPQIKLRIMREVVGSAIDLASSEWTSLVADLASQMLNDSQLRLITRADPTLVNFVEETLPLLLARRGDFVEAAKQMMANSNRLTDTKERDFGYHFLFEEVLRNIKATARNDTQPETETNNTSESLQSLVARMETIAASVRSQYDSIVEHARSEYGYFKIPNLDSSVGNNSGVELLSDGTASALTNASSKHFELSLWTPTRLIQLPSPQQFDAFVSRREPFIVSIEADSGMVSGESPPLIQDCNWTVAWGWGANEWCSRAGAESIKLGILPPPHKRDRIGTVMDSEHTNFCSFVNKVFNESAQEVNGYYHLGASANSASLDPNSVYYFPMDRVQESFPIPAFMQNSKTFRTAKVAMWIGKTSAPRSSGLHFDVMDNVHVAFRGTKRWTVFSPNDAVNMEYIDPVKMVTSDGTPHLTMERSKTSKYGIYSRFSKVGYVSLVGEDDHRHSRVSSATGAVFDLNEGDMLYLPGGWAHEVESTGTSVAVTLWSDFQRGSN